MAARDVLLSQASVRLQVVMAGLGRIAPVLPHSRGFVSLAPLLNVSALC
jgi:hypothetical protein